jgi:succinoglycan biosynthesis transport protein ExoP
MDEIEKSRMSTTQSIVRTDGEFLVHNEKILDIPAEAETPQLLEYWNLILKRRWTVVACALVVFTTVAIGTLKQQPLYEGKVLIEINPQPPNVVSFREIEQVNPLDFDSYRETQYKVIQSRTLAERVVHDLRLYQYPEFYRAKLAFGLFVIDPDKIPSPSDHVPPGQASEAYRNTVSNFLNSIDVSPVRRSNLVEVTFYSHDPALAARIANQLSSDYIDQNLQVKWDQAAKASEWLSGKLAELKANLEKSQGALQEYAQRNNIVYFTGANAKDQDRQNLVMARLEQLQQEYTKAQGDRFQKESLYTLVQEGKEQDLPGVLTNSMIQTMMVNQSNLQRDYARLSTTYKPEYPRALALKKQLDVLQAAIDKQKKALIQNIVDDYRAAVAREKFLSEAIEEQKKVVQDIAERSITYNILKREVDTNELLYENMLGRMGETQVSTTMNASNIRIVDAAEVPKAPVKPRILLNLTLGLILGIGLGVGLAFFQEYLDNTLKTPDDVEHFLRLPSLGLLPSLSLNGSGEADEDRLLAVSSESAGRAEIKGIQSDPMAMEAFRSLRTSILLSASPVPRLILITSALPGEGKTTTAVSLGVTLASLGSRVVVVDCDMRKPACHLTAGVENRPGFVKCLTGQTDLAEAILPVPGVANLSVIPCGPIPPNPAEVLSSPVTGELLQRLRTQFDYVLLDSPPVLSVADTRILATLTDAVVLVTRAHSTPYDVVRRARTTLYGSGARILGVALNAVNLERAGYGPKRYYQSGMGYGYAPESEPVEEQHPVD